MPVEVEKLHLNGFVTEDDSIRIDTIRDIELTEELGSRGGTDSRDGTITPDPPQMVYLITVHLFEEDRERIAAFTKQSEGHRVLFRIGEHPLIAPVVNFPIDVPSFQITLGIKDEANAIHDKLKLLVDGKD